MFQIRRITASEVDDAIKLSEYSFKYQLEGEARAKRASFMQNHIIFGAFQEDNMIAKTHVIPLRLLIDNEEYSMGGIASVSTYPEYRRKGLVNQLMAKALKTMKEEGHIISYLHPFDVNFYRKYGYELISNLKKTEVANKDFNYYKEVEGRLERKRTFEDIEIINRIYKSYISNYNGMLIRNEKWWRENAYDGGYLPVIYFDKYNEAKGYIFYKIKDNIIDVQEFIYLDEDSRRGLWNFIANHDSMVEKLEITTPDDEEMSFLFYNPAVKTEIIPYFMGRIVLVKEFLDKYIKLDGLTTKLHLYIIDDIADWNNGAYSISSKGIEFLEMDQEAIKDKYTREKAFFMDINTMTALFLGFKSADFLYKSGRITGDISSLEDLKSIITKKPCSFLDYF